MKVENLVAWLIAILVMLWLMQSLDYIWEKMIVQNNELIENNNIIEENNRLLEVNNNLLQNLIDKYEEWLIININ